MRGILFARLAGCVSGHTAVRLTAAERVAALLGGPAPRVPSGGPAGPDEAAVMAAALAGVRRDDLGEAERRALAEPAPCPAALAADTALRSRHRLESAQAVCALSIEAFGAPLGAYDAALDDLWGDAHEAAVLRALRRHLDGAGTDGRRFHQAPVSYRIIPRVLGQAHRAVAAVEKAAATALRAVTGDVLLAGRVLPSGGFHNGMAYPAMNALSAAWADLALVAERQVTALNTAETSGLPVNLAVPGGADRHLRLRLGGEQLRRGGAGRGRARAAARRGRRSALRRAVAGVQRAPQGAPRRGMPRRGAGHPGDRVQPGAVRDRPQPGRAAAAAAVVRALGIPADRRDRSAGSERGRPIAAAGPGGGGGHRPPRPRTLRPRA